MSFKKSEDLFDFTDHETQSSRSPLAHRMRPRSLDEFFGQEKVLGPGKPLRQWISADRVPSLIFWGPPGTGKTTLAQIIAGQTQAGFEALSAVLSGVKDIKEAVARARENLRMSRRKTILFVDEIHRFNKSQQDALLPHVEDGTVTLIGATTENPSFELNSALLSRARVMRLERLSAEALSRILNGALEDSQRGLGGFLRLAPEAVQWLAETSEGDARRALTSLESISLFVGTAAGTRGEIPLGIKEVKEALESAMERQPIPYDKVGDEHYNVISAFIKSIRGNNPHAGLYYLARMLEGGEDPLFIARRLVILASEDVGNADPRGLQIAIAVKEAVEFVGMPEARINLAQAVTYLAAAPKSNASYLGISEALEEVRKTGALPVPLNLRNGAVLTSGRTFHLPEELIGKRFYSPKEAGLERQIKERLDQLNVDFDRK